MRIFISTSFTGTYTSGTKSATSSFRFSRFRNRPGMTFIEMAVAFIILMAIIVAAYEVITESHLSNANLSAWNDLTEWGQTITNNINLELSQGRIIYENDDLGNAYLNRLSLDANLPMLNTSRLPTIDPAGRIGPDTIISRTGNSLLFVQELAPFVGDANGTLRRVDVYQLVFYYLSITNRPIGTRNTSLIMVKWISVPFADYSQVASIPETGNQRSTFLVNLYDSPRDIKHLWIPRNDPNNAFFEIASGGNMLTDTAYIIESRRTNSVVASLGAGFASVAWNSGATFAIPDPVPNFAQGNMIGNGFPNGFEVQVVGQSGSRKVFTRLVLAYYVALNRSIYSNVSTTVVTFHDL